MSDAKNIIRLFQQSDRMIINYLSMIENMQRHIRARVDHGIPLPQGALVALHHGVGNSLQWLSGALNDLENDKRILARHLTQIRITLSFDNHNFRTISDAKNLVTSWSNNAERSMETVINQHYEHSEILPSPTAYWQKIGDKFYQYFPYLSNDVRWREKMESVASYLNTIENPWAKYAVEIQ